jgi:hypothetical protein
VGVVMAPAMVMAIVAIPVMAALATAVAMAAIQAPMVPLFMHPRRLHPHNQLHRPLTLLRIHPKRLHSHNQPHRPMAKVAIPSTVVMVVALTPLPMVVLAMAVAIPVPMVCHMDPLPRRPHPHKRQHLLLPGSQTSTSEEPAQVGVISPLLKELTCLDQQAITFRFDNMLPDYSFNDNLLITSGFVNAYVP